VVESVGGWMYGWELKNDRVWCRTNNFNVWLFVYQRYEIFTMQDSGMGVSD
jgi:hypothetical protein